MQRNRALFPQNRRSPRQIGDFRLFDGAARIGLRGIQPVNCGFGVMSDVQPGFSGLGADVLRVGFIRFLMKSVVGGFCQLFCVFQHAVPPLLFAGDGLDGFRLGFQRRRAFLFLKTQAFSFHADIPFCASDVHNPAQTAGLRLPRLYSRQRAGAG